MQTTFYKQPPLYWMLAPFKPTFRLFLACEDQAAYFQARKVHEQVKELCRNEINVSHGFWSFALLRSPQLRAQAVVEATEADMIIISLAGNDETPTHVRQLLENLPARELAGQAALVVLIGAGEDGAQPLTDLAWLKELAESRGLDFFCNQDGWERLDLSKPSLRRGEFRSMTPENIIAPNLSWDDETQ